MITENLPHPRIQPTLTRHFMSLTSEAQLKNIKKKRLNVYTFKVVERISEYTRNDLFDYKPKRLVPYFKHQKFCTGLEIMDKKLACLNTFSRVKVLVHNLRKFSVFINPTDPKLTNFVRRIGKNKCLAKVNDLYGKELYTKKKKLFTRLYSPIKEMKFFPNLNFKMFLRLKTLEIPDFGPITKEINFPRTLECIKLNGNLSEDNVRKMNTLKNLKQLSLNMIFNDSYQIAFRNLQLNNMIIRLATSVSTFTSPKTVDNIKRFIEETNSKVVFIPRNYTPQELMSCLVFLEQNFNECDRFQLELPFAFNSRPEVQESVLTHYSKMSMSVQLLFSFEIGALYASQDLRKENWEKMLDLAITNASRNKLRKVTFSVKYNNEIGNKEFLNKMIDTAASLIKPVIESKRNGTFTPSVEAHIKLDCSKGDERLSDFLTKSLIVANDEGLPNYKYYSRNFYINIKTTNIALEEEKCVKCLSK